MKQRDFSNHISVPDELQNEDIVKHTVISYLKMQAHAQIHLKQPHLNHVCSKQVCSYIHHRYETLLKRMKVFNCKIEYYKVEPTFNSVTFDGQICTVKVISNESLKFTQMKTETLRHNFHEIILSKTKNKWIIVSDIDDEYDKYIVSRKVKEQNKKDDSSIEFQLDLIKKISDIKKSSNFSSDAMERTVRLNREKMKQYQLDNWNARPKQWGNFDDMGGDCTNYASEVLYAGGAPMITSSNYKWFYYSYSNRTPSWTGVEQFYDYLIKNKANGIHGIDLPSNLELETGDIIQVDLDGDGIFNHTSVVYEPFGYMDLLPTITSHTLDRFNEPILTLNFTDIRWIHLK